MSLFFLRASYLCQLLVVAMICAPATGCLNNGMSRRDTGDSTDHTAYGIRDDDAEMRAAVMVAQHRFGEFRKAYADAAPGDSFFLLKVPFTDSNVVEEMWLDVIGEHNNRYTGILISAPEAVHTVKMGDTVTIGAAEASDWAYEHNGRAMGDFSTRVIRKRMEPKERAAFDKETNGKYVE